MSKKTALITGITGQDGSYLSRFLLDKGYAVHGVKRRSSSFNTERIDDIFEDNNFVLHYGDMTDATNLIRLIQDVQPDEIYNLAAQSHVQVSFEMPEYTANADGLGVLRLLEAIRILKLEKKTRFLQASTSELYGITPPPQSETTPFHPRSPYAVAKLYGYWLTINYREAYGMFASNAISFNHESPVRGETFVSRKVTRAVASIYHDYQDKLFLGNLDAERDWGHAGDYVEGLWHILQHNEGDDFVLATGQVCSVRQFVEKTFKYIDIDIEWRGAGVNEQGIDKKTGRVLVEVDPRYFRPTEVPALIGDATKAKTKLGWQPSRNLEQLIDDMIKSDMKVVEIEHQQRSKYAQVFN